VPSVFISPTAVPKIISFLKGESTAEIVLTTEHKLTTTVVSVHEEQKINFYSTAENTVLATSSATSTDQSTTSLQTVSSTTSAEPKQFHTVSDNSTTANFEADSVKLASGGQTNGDVVTDGMLSSSFFSFLFFSFVLLHLSVTKDTIVHMKFIVFLTQKGVKLKLLLGWCMNHLR
jgi:hypothetical protein